ncbi:TPA: hypothetical protein MEA92_004920 [Klebsiella aerogenes]|uniref:conjugal transfer protein TraP n=1 Tax=Enterobacteriaceae TaxID=543 RepID=UPI0005ED85E3|nr:conjugal transfer protein TraP [Klebsiella aerogenes]KJO59168.1 hypothetical protein SR89_10055 [Klebsiella aerogenes]HBV9946050.1 hypothetical protein [Klebsiella aerogenes]
MIISNTLSHVINRTMPVINYSLRVFTWFFYYLFVFPVALMVIITSFLFWHDNTTPGTELVRAISAAKIESSPDDFLITRCHAVPIEMTRKEIPPNIFCEKEAIKVNAEEYASHVDRKLWGLFRVLWTSLAVVFGLVAFFLRSFPSFRSCDREQYAYGIARKVSSEAKENE